MKQLISIVLAVLFLLPFSAFAEIKTITHTVQQPFGGSQSPDDARIAGIARAKREALEQFGTYIESTIVVKDSAVDSDEILALTAGVTKAEVIKQRNYTDGDGFGLEITVKVELETAVLETSLKRLLEDRNHLKDLKAAREREKKLLARVVELEKQDKKKGKTKKQSATLKKEFKAASQELTAVEWFDKAMVFWDGKKYSDPKKVIEYLIKAIHLEPNAAGAYTNRGGAYNDLKLFERAIADYDKAIRLDPNNITAYYNRGLAYDHLKQFDRAIADYDLAIRLNPNHVDVYTNRGGAYSNLKQLDRAMADYDQAIRLDPNDAKTYYNRGNAFTYLKQFDRAIADYDQAIRIDPNLERAYSNRGNAYYYSKQLDHAMADYDQAIRLDPNDATAYGNRGLAYTNFKQFDRAIVDYDQAIRINPNNADAYTNRGGAYSNLKQFERAIADYDKAIRLDPNDALNYNNRGIAYLLLHKTQKGCADLKKGLFVAVSG